MKYVGHNVVFIFYFLSSLFFSLKSRAESRDARRISLHKKIISMLSNKAHCGTSLPRGFVSILLPLLVPICSSFLIKIGSIGHQKANAPLPTTMNAKPYASVGSDGLVSNQRKETVAVIGGGIAGLSCAAALKSSGKFDPTVFDTGRLRPGGRCSSRLPGDPPKDPSEKHPLLDQTVIDHAAQILTVPQNGYIEFQKQVNDWEKQGILKRFSPGSVCDILADNKKSKGKAAFRLKQLSGNMYYGSNGMGSIPTRIGASKAFPIEQDKWVSPSNGVVRYEKEQKWKIKANGKNLGKFDRLIIAHNGKCADRLMSKTPAKALHSLLRTNFSPTVPAWGGKRMTLNSIYSFTFAIDRKTSPISRVLPDDFICGFVKNEQALRFLSCNTRKYDNNKENSDIEIWTVLSSAKFGKKHKGPQEFLPTELVTEVSGLLLEATERSLCLAPGTLRGTQEDSPGRGIVLDSRLQLWGAAVPLNTWTTSEKTQPHGFLYDSKYYVGACGDWLLEASIAGAWESGRRLANWMSSEKGSRQSVGLPPNENLAFQSSAAVAKAGIGSL